MRSADAHDQKRPKLEGRRAYPARPDGGATIQVEARDDSGKLMSG